MKTYMLLTKILWKNMSYGCEINNFCERTSHENPNRTIL
ncbi:hypothetical protein F383_14494 [Gossypium arboreum]|uniref:Uncharacterized protein n=1 Tax=Gossypium arboreum TaxID=29729 RepID=A0A0B0PT18_GOSAR|nr:hypothetical protein F383_14494 [Gossypium arboreum]